MRRVTPRVLITTAILTGCGSQLPPGTTEFTVGRTVVRTDSMLDLAGVLFSISDTSLVAPRGPVRHWLEGLRPLAGDSAMVLARAVGAAPVSAILEGWSGAPAADSVCGLVAPDERVCFTGAAPVRATVSTFLASARGAWSRIMAVPLDLMTTEQRLQDLADVYTALTRGKAMDSAVIAYSGYGDLTFDVTLARTLATGSSTPQVDPARPLGPRRTIYLPPDAVFPVRAYRSPNYVWLVLLHQMSHDVVRRLFAERPELLAHGFHLREAAEPEMAKVGYTGVFWDETLGEQLARAVTVRILRATNPTATWAARSDALNGGMALVPWIEDALAQYEARRDSFPTLSAFAERLAAAVDAVPLDTCRGATSPGLAVAGVAHHRGVVTWIAPASPFRAQRLLVGDTVLTIDGDSVAASELALPTRQLNVKWAQHLPAELGMLTIRRGGRTYGLSVPINWERRPAVRVASQSRDAVRAPADSVAPICRWITRARRT